MKQKPAKEFFCRQRQCFLYIPVRPVSPGEANYSTLKRNQAMVGNGHSMSVAAEIFENIFRPAKWPFAVNHPIAAIEIANEVIEHLWIG